MSAIWARLHSRARSAANPNLEVAKFGLYVTFPLLFMAYFGDPSWYEKYVAPFREAFAKPELQRNRPPRTQAELQEELTKYRGQRGSRLGTVPVESVQVQEQPSTQLADKLV